MKLIDNN